MNLWRQLAQAAARLAARLARGLHGPGARRAVRRLRPGLAENRTALLAFDDCSSGEFSALADCLATLDGRLAGIATEAALLDTILADNDEDRARHSAFELFKKSVDLAHSSIGIALSQEEEMQQLEGSLLQNRGQFEQNSLMFRVLVLNMRAEAARIDPENRAVFTAVAGEMAAMEEQMRVTVEKAFAELENIVHEAASGRQQLQSLQTGLHQGAQASIKLLRTELDAIATNLAPCAAASHEITALLVQTRAQTGALITSLQYQDIVRQQLDHVSQGFADIATHLESAAGPDLGYLHQAALVQQAQLRASRQAIEEAGRQIDTASSALLATGAALLERFTRMEQVASRVFQSSGLGALFEQETDRLVQVAGQSEATNVRIAQLLDRIEASVRVFSIEIRRHEFDVLLVALNAQIAAVRVPHARALDKLAEETAQLAAATAVLTGLMSRQLGDTLARLQGMRTEAESVRQTIGREKSELTSGSAVVKDKLNRLNDRIQRSTGDSATHFTAAYERVRDLLPTLRFPAMIAPSFAPAEASCTQLLAATGAFAAAGLVGEAAGLVAEHRSRYTMQQEREAHAAALGTDPTGAAAAEATTVATDSTAGDVPVPAGATAPTPAADHGLGEGIDLF